ncbi:MAG: hypothetical protein Q9219_000281 [cf. Caloplaca sp. 3 TL-2023]
MGDRERPPKRRKTTKVHSSSDQLQGTFVVPLLHGKEAQHMVQLRSALFDKVWKSKEQIIDDNNENATFDTVEKVSEFIYKEISGGYAGSSIPSGLITTGHSSSVYTSLVSAISERLKPRLKAAVVNIIPSQVSNLKSVLKLINSRATDTDLDGEEDDLPKPDQVLSICIQGLFAI